MWPLRTRGGEVKASGSLLPKKCLYLRLPLVTKLAEKYYETCDAGSKSGKTIWVGIKNNAANGTMEWRVREEGKKYELVDMSANGRWVNPLCPQPIDFVYTFPISLDIFLYHFIP